MAVVLQPEVWEPRGRQPWSSRPHTPVDAAGPDPSAAAESQWWLDRLAGTGPEHEAAVARLHDLLLRAARFEVRRRRSGLPGVSPGELDDLAHQATADALVALLAKLSAFRGESRFTTWAYKFVLLEAAVKVRRRAWQGREVTLEAAAWPDFPAPGPSAQQSAEAGELLGAVRDAVATALTPHQREVLTALALNEVPIDVLAERLGTTRGALYKTLHDARRKLRATLAAAGYAVDGGGWRSP
jgi:RNA polymerase sigma-70 factor, ECF subfamily